MKWSVRTNNMVGIKSKITSMLFVVMLMIMNTVPVFGFEKYVHDPMANPGAAADIVVNPKAVYGYSPSPDSKRLKEYVDYDWSDPVFVEKMRKQREEYHDSIKELYVMITTMRTAVADVKDIAMAVSTRRNEIRLESYKNDPEGLAKIKKSNLENFGNESGGTPEFFYKKYGSWETVIEKALSTNAGADACLGIYDKYYDTYFFAPTSTQNINKPVSFNAETDTYTVLSGDTLSLIAESKLGDRNKWTILFNLNRDVIRDPNLIRPGQLLKIK